MRHLSILTLTLTTLLVGHAWPAAAQPTSATLRGHVHDAQGRSVVGASVAVSGRGNGVARSIATDAAGEFVVANLPPGTVTVTVVAPGFAALKRTVVLEVAQAAAVEIELSIGPVREDVTVVASPVAVDTTRSVVDAVIAVGRHRGAAAQRPQLPRAGVARAGQRAGAELRSDQDQQRGHLVGGPARPRRQHHHRRRRQQRRRGRRAAAERHRRRRCRSSRSRPTASPPRPGRSASSVINVVTKSGTRRAARIGVALPARQRWQALPATFDRTSAGDAAVRSPAGRRSRSAGRSSRGKRVLVRRRRSTATRTAPCWSARATRATRTIRRDRSRRRRSTICSARSASTGAPATATTSMIRYAGEQRERHRREHARSRDRLGVAAAASTQPLPLGASGTWTRVAVADAA